MRFNFDFTTAQVIWTLTFAALLVLLVVLLGRDRARRFPWFTVSIVLLTLQVLASRVLSGRMPQFTLQTIFITLADGTALVGVLVLVELARRAFPGAQRRTWLVGILALLAVGAAVLYFWGPWPDRKTITVDSLLAVLRLMQLVAQKGAMLVNVLTIELGLVVVLFGRRFKAGWRSHTQLIAIGLSTAAIAQLAVQGAWQTIAMRAAPQTQSEYERLLGLRDKLFNANSAIYVAVLVWWIVWLWLDEPVAAAAGAAAQIPASAGVVEAKTDAPVEAE